MCYQHFFKVRNQRNQLDFKMKHWREAASLIALTKTHVKKQQTISNGYKILFQKRSDKSGFMPSNIVFPGGVTDQSDFDEKWIKYLKSFNIPSKNFTQFQNPNSDVPLLFQDNADPNLKHIALRITAIRETFEEAGLLLCRSRNIKDDKNSTLARPYLKEFDVDGWQKKVNKNPSEFFNLCKELDCYPDVWSLHLWSNWLTPTTKPKRFNTAFFIAFLNTQPDIHIDHHEVVEYMWSTPNDVLESFKAKNLVLATPQWYELTKFKNISSEFDELHKYAASRSTFGCELLLPIYQKTKDSMIVTFPGDELYPDHPDLINTLKLSLQDKTHEELQKENKTLHRMIFQDPHDITFQVKNYSPKYFQFLPSCTTLPTF